METSVEMAIQLGWKHYNPAWSEHINNENARNYLVSYYTSNSRQPYSVLNSKQRDSDEARAERPVRDGAAAPVKTYAQAYSEGFAAGVQLDLIAASKTGKIVKPKKQRKHEKGR